MGEFRRQGIEYASADFTCTSEFLAIIMNKYPKMCIACPALGRMPSKRECCPDFDKKNREQTSPPLQPFCNPYNLLILILVQCGNILFYVK